MYTASAPVELGAEWLVSTNRLDDGIADIVEGFGTVEFDEDKTFRATVSFEDDEEVEEGAKEKREKKERRDKRERTTEPGNGEGEVPHEEDCEEVSPTAEVCSGSSGEEEGGSGSGGSGTDNGGFGSSDFGSGDSGSGSSGKGGSGSSGAQRGGGTASQGGVSGAVSDAFGSVIGRGSLPNTGGGYAVLLLLVGAALIGGGLLVRKLAR